VGAFSNGVGSTDLAIALATGKNWFKVPEDNKNNRKRQSAWGVSARQIILYIIGKVGADGATL
jgi:3-isopropylmalate/(R)-2-methylmalate dehydratase large subunit